MTKPYRVLLRAGASRTEWLDARRVGIGGSDAAAVLGFSGRRNPLDVYTDKVTTLPGHDRDSEDALWGRILEDVVAREWARREHRSVRRAPALVQSTRWPWMVASLDRFATEVGSKRIAGLLEVKTRSAWVSRDWDDELPADVTAQTLHYLAVYGLPVAYVACLVGGQELRTFTVEGDSELLEEIAETERQWWESYVVPRVLPPLVGGDNAHALTRLHAAPEGTLEFDVDGIELLRQRAKVEDAGKAMKAERAELDDKIRLKLGDHVEGHIGGVKYVAWSPSAGSRSCDYDRLEHDYPAAYLACVTQGAPSRRLTFSKKAIPS